MNRFKCPACGGNQYTSCDTAQGCIYCGHKELKKMETLEPEESEGMREIKFRGKSLRTGKWVYGSLVRYGDGRVEIYTPFNPRDENSLRAWLEEVYPATVGQYTGLKDKNGKEIYEGDIIWWGKDDHAPVSYVFYDDGAFKVSDPESDTWELLIDVLNGAEVIGNIYENPELLKE